MPEISLGGTPVPGKNQSFLDKKRKKTGMAIRRIKEKEKARQSKKEGHGVRGRVWGRKGRQRQRCWGGVHLWSCLKGKEQSKERNFYAGNEGNGRNKKGGKLVEKCKPPSYNKTTSPQKSKEMQGGGKQGKDY